MKKLLTDKEVCERVVVVEGVGCLVKALRGWPGEDVTFTIVVNGPVWLVQGGLKLALVDGVELVLEGLERLVLGILEPYVLGILEFLVVLGK